MDIRITLEHTASPELLAVLRALVRVPALEKSPTPTEAAPEPIVEKPTKPAKVKKQDRAADPVTEKATEPAPVADPEPVKDPVPDTPTPAESTPAPDYDTLCRAGAKLASQGKLKDLAAIMSSLGVQALPQVKPAQYAELADKLRAIGADL